MPSQLLISGDGSRKTQLCYLPKNPQTIGGSKSPTSNDSDSRKPLPCQTSSKQSLSAYQLPLLHGKAMLQVRYSDSPTPTVLQRRETEKQRSTNEKRRLRSKPSPWYSTTASHSRTPGGSWPQASPGWLSALSLSEK